MTKHLINKISSRLITMSTPSSTGLFPWPSESYFRNPGALKDSHGKDVKLFTPFKIRDVTLKNRIVVAPMCQYSSKDGFFSDWHLVHLGSFAVGGAGLIIAEATGVAPEGRISPHDTGLWKDEHITQLQRIVNFIHEHKAAAGIQIAHAGRKASTEVPWHQQGDSAAVPDNDPRRWQPVGASPIAFSDTYIVPAELSKQQILAIQQQFVDTAVRAHKAGFDVLEIHGAHGYLLSSFCSPNANKRTDEYGAGFEGRTKLMVDVTKAVRAVWPASKPLFVRISCEEWVEDGWHLEDSVRLSALLKEAGADVIHCSSGGINVKQQIKAGPGFQVPFAEEVRKRCSVPTCAVGLITEPKQAEEILQKGQADLIALAREFLRNDRWPYYAARELGVDVEWVPQYERAKPRL